jgi:cyclophilin family peptidyl-prolyl cis-trans isomerase
MRDKHTRKPVYVQGCYNMNKSFQGEIYMTPKKKAKQAEAEKTQKIIQYVAIAVVVIVIALIAWPYMAKLMSPKVDAVTPASIEDVGSVAVESTTVVESPISTGGTTACGAFDSIAAAKQYDQAPPMKIDQAKQYFATFKMAKGGEFVVELYPAKAPITVNSFVFLACKNFFDGVTFHRVLEGFMAQGGDPTGTGGGGPGYEFVNENSDLTFDKDGVLAMANAGPDTNGSQFFITFGAQEFLNGGYTIFGRVVEGMDVVNGITRRDPDQSPTFAGDAIETIAITEK